MKRYGRLVFVFVVFFVLCNILQINTMVVKAAPSNIFIDGYYDDWSDKPYSWEYNHDNSYIIPNYWDGTQNITKYYLDENGSPYNLEIRHKMAIYSDGENIFLHIEISSKPGSGLNGEDYRFYIDGEMAAFRITYVGGDNITKNDKKTDSGIYQAEVRHRETGLSNTVVNGAEAAFTKKDNDDNNEIEIKIPLTAMKLQNPDMNIDKFNTVEFYCPNLMYRRIAASGVSTNPYVGLAICVAFAGGAVLINKFRLRSKKA